MILQKCSSQTRENEERLYIEQPELPSPHCLLLLQDLPAGWGGHAEEGHQQVCVCTARFWELFIMSEISSLLVRGDGLVMFSLSSFKQWTLAKFLMGRGGDVAGRVG